MSVKPLYKDTYLNPLLKTYPAMNFLFPLWNITVTLQETALPRSSASFSLWFLLELKCVVVSSGKLDGRAEVAVVVVVYSHIW